MPQKKQLVDFRNKIEELKRRFKLLVTELEEAAREQGWKGFNAKVESLAELEELYTALEKQWNRQEQNKERIAELLAKAENIALNPPENAIDLKHFREKLESYRQLLFLEGKSKKAVELRRQLLKGAHPLNALLALLQKNLPLKKVEELFETAAAEFGTSLALAAVRGNIILKEKENGVDPSLSPGINAGAGHQGTKELPEKVSGLLHRLIREGKLSPAFWLAAYCEHEYGSAPVPSWLIKALEAAFVIRQEEGTAAQWLSYLYRKHHFTVSPGADSKDKLALELLFFSALLRPALAAPKSGALSLLSKGGVLPGELKNLVAAVLADDRSSEKDTTTKQELEDLFRDVKSWCKQNRKLTLASPLASQLWETMLEEGGLVYRLLQPVMGNEQESLKEIRELVRFLHERDNLKKELGRLYRELPGVPEKMEIFHIPGSWQVINRLISALKLAERYIKLQEKAEKTLTLDSTPKAEEICRLLKPARKELNQLALRYDDDPLLETALVVTGRALDSVEKYFKEKAEKNLTPEEASSLEVQENPQLMLKPPWEPQKKTVERMGKALLELLNDYLPPKETEGESAFLVREEERHYELKQNRRHSTIPADLDNLYRSELLTPQEREFIQKTIKSLQDN